MSNVLLIQNTRIEGSGHLGDLLKKDGFEITSVNAKHEPIPDGKFSLVVILGAPESANDDLPYLKNERELIRTTVEHDVPLLGICLGSQLIAKTFGGRVYSGPKKEIGFYHDLKTEQASNLFSGFENPFTVFHWHGDTFDLPEGSTHLISSNDFQNQAFRYKSAVGLQFHLEVNSDMVNLWLDKTEEKLNKIPYIDPQKIREDVNQHILTVNKNMDRFYKNFKSEFSL